MARNETSSPRAQAAPAAACSSAAGKPRRAIARRMLGRYQLIAPVGEGGMARAYVARLCGPAGFSKVVIVKVIHPHLARQREFLEMFLEEARISALLNHPHIVDIYDLGKVGQTYFIAMEYLSGQPLTRLITRGAKHPLDVFCTAKLIAQVADGLHAAHNLMSPSGKPLRLVHRDVSPGNILVLYDGSVKLLDFGISKACGRNTATEPGLLKGKMRYVSPEQIQGRYVDHRSDVFALGVVLWEALTRRKLFDGDSDAAVLNSILQGNPLAPSMIRSDVTDELDAICLRALATRPDDRFQSAEDMRIAIEKHLLSVARIREVRPTRVYMEQVFADCREQERKLFAKAFAPEEPAEEDADTDVRDPAGEAFEVLTQGNADISASEPTPRPDRPGRKTERWLGGARRGPPVAPHGSRKGPFDEEDTNVRGCDG